jgi:AbrB family looped-hinge helix DNA binding protein
MRVTSKGQVTIPMQIRRRHGIRAGTEVAFVENGKDILVSAAAKKPGRSRRGEDDEFAAYLDRVTGIVDVGMATDDFMQLLRGE